MSARFELLAGSPLSVLSSDGQSALVECDTAFPPGSTLSFRVLRTEPSPADEYAPVVQLKVRSCRRDSETSRYRIEGRFVSLPRPVRELLLSLR